MAHDKKLIGITYLYAEVIVLHASGVTDDQIGLLLDEKPCARTVRRYKKEIMYFFCDEGYRDMSVVIQKVSKNGLLEKWMNDFAEKHPKAVARLKKIYNYTETEFDGEPFYVVTPE